jgi:hypothetical protein
MKHIIEYEVVHAMNHGDLSEEVNRCIRDGYQPFGSPVMQSVADGSDGFDEDCWQAIVKYSGEF